MIKRREDDESLNPMKLAKVATGSYLGDMRVVGIKVLKNKLSEYVRIAASGETVLVTDRDRVVAELGPPRPERGATVADARLQDAIARGIIRPPAARTGKAPPKGRHLMPLEELLADLDRDREDR